MDLISVDERVEKINNKLRTQLFQKGVKGLKGLARTFKIADFSGNKQLDKDEFEEALSFAGLFLKKDETSLLFSYYDTTSDGNISYDEFVKGLAAPLNQRRAAMVQKVFKLLDKNNSGDITKDDVAGMFNGKKHPSVLKGEKTMDEVLDEFLNGFDGARGNNDGVVTWAEWSGYYRDLSASVPSDDYFIAMMEGVWMIREDGATDEVQERMNRLCDILKEKVRQKTKGGGSEQATLQKSFNFFDQDESGMVTKDEFRQALMQFGITLEKKDIGAFFGNFDTDGSGTITTQEFCDNLYGSK